MNNLKKILFPFFSIFLTFQSYELLRNLMASNPEDILLVESLKISFLFTLFVTGVFAFTGFAYSTYKVLPNSYYKIRNENALNTAHKILGVDYFKRILLFVFWGRKKNRKKYFDGTKKGLRNFDFQTRQSEFGHLGAFVIIFVSSFVLLINGYILIFSIIFFINIIGNLYPIILQRTHRLKIERKTKHNST